ncbi:MAG: undecaprenyl-phosphate glucose phosphotransferase [Pseudomonadota bacterium]
MLTDGAAIAREETERARQGETASAEPAGDWEDRPLTGAALEAAGLIETRPMSPAIVAGLIGAGEWLTISLIGTLLFLAYLGAGHELAWLYVTSLAVMPISAVMVFNAIGLYAPYALRSIGHVGPRLAAAWTLVFAGLLAAAFFTNLGDDLSRLWVGLWFVLGFLALIAYRLTTIWFVRGWTASGKLQRSAVLVGGGPQAEALVLALNASGESDLKLVGFFDDRGDNRSETTVAGLPKLGTVDDAVVFARKTNLDTIIVTLPITAEKRVLDMARKLWVLPVDVRLSAHTARLRFRPRAYNYIGSVPFLAIFDRPLSDWDFIAKAALDRLVGALMLVGLSPVLLATAIAIKLDSKGPVLFRQTRFGFNNEPIKVFKFRSMYTDMCDANATKLVTKGDPRVTRVGRFIRKTSIDELPQLFNVVFKGDLSLVGPRPHAMAAKAAGGLYQNVVDGYFARHKVKPGITGWAQVNGWRGETDTDEKIERRVEHDLYYIENWSVLLDLRIIAMTPFALMTKTEGAY